ncbi:hypothetical protein PoB_006625700 [Plakobranchus ocellatus]|uniref:Uncharacterized protein n=1 Tax=Plakobranchus ocellatus TaxID=259542 RepID=A0AAV4D6C3_9GAST|nr:hypothetical protein PoB_006625700 [Plakobranchus ocellatus]
MPKQAHPGVQTKPNDKRTRKPLGQATPLPSGKTMAAQFHITSKLPKEMDICQKRQGRRVWTALDSSGQFTN